MENTPTVEQEAEKLAAGLVSAMSGNDSDLYDRYGVRIYIGLLPFARAFLALREALKIGRGYVRSIHGTLAPAIGENNLISPDLAVVDAALSSADALLAGVANDEASMYDADSFRSAVLAKAIRALPIPEENPDER